MRNWIGGKYKLAAIAVAGVVISSTVSVLAYTNLNFSTKAKEWQSANCTQKELDLPKAREQSAICYGVAGVDKNALEIEAVKQAVNNNSGNNSVYTLINSDTTYPNVDAGVGTIESLVPVDSVLSNLTILAKGGADKVIDSGRVDFTVLVNGTEVALGTYLDKDHTRNSALSNDVSVNAGDVVQVKIESSGSLVLTGTQPPACTPWGGGGYSCHEGVYPKLSLHIGLYSKPE